MMAPLEAAAGTLCAGLPGEPEVFFEVPLAAGVPDMVAVAFDAAVLKRRLEAGLAPVVNVSAVRTLTALSAGAVEVAAISDVAGLSTGYLRRSVLPGLAAAGWVQWRAGTVVRLLHDFVPVVSWAVTVEAKRAGWAQAVSQAQRHVVAADRAFVALDAARAGAAVAHAAHLARAGVGLVTVRAVHDADGVEGVQHGSMVEVASFPMVGRPRLPRARRSPNVCAKALLGERVWELALGGCRSGPTHLVFGRDLSIA